MEYSNVRTLRRRFWRLVSSQHGVVARPQLLALGFGAQAIKRRIAGGRLHPVRPGVYAVGRPELTAQGRWMAAVLICGEGARLSHGSAAASMDIEEELDGIIEVTVPGHRRPRGAQDIRIHRRSLPPEDLGEFDRIPVTSPGRTLLDLAARLPEPRLETAVNKADKLDLIDPEDLRAFVDTRAGTPGAPALRGLLDHHTFLLTDSELERRFIPIARRAGLPAPLTGQLVNGFRVDFHWPDLDLVVETDGLRYHRTPAQQTRDRVRDQAHVAAGLIPLRFTHAQVRYESGHVEDTLAQVTRGRRPGRAP